MSLFDKIEAVKRSQIYRHVGSFWTSIFAQKDKARGLVDLTFKNSVLGNFQSLVDDLRGDFQQARQVHYIDIDFQQHEVIVTGMLVYDDPDAMDAYGVSHEATKIFNDFRIRYFALPLTSVIPVKIQAHGKTLTHGIDFFIQAKRWLYFREDPRQLFPKGSYHVISGWELLYQSNISLLTRTWSPGQDQHVVNWMRNIQTPGTLRLALAAAANLSIIGQGGRLLSRTVNQVGQTIYAFEHETVRVAYPHTPLVLGKEYSAGTVVGNVVTVLQAPKKKDQAWWREVDWRGGICLDPIVPQFKRLQLPDAMVTAYSAGSDPDSVDGSQLHVRLALTDDVDNEQAYWSWVGDYETRHQLYINRLIGLPEDVVSDLPGVNDSFEKLLRHTQEANRLNTLLHYPLELPQVKSLVNQTRVNALDTFFQLLLTHTALVVAIDARHTPTLQELYSFLAREMPAGSTNVIFAWWSVSDEAVLFSEESVNISPQDSFVITEVVDLEDSVAVSEFVNLTPIPA